MGYSKKLYNVLGGGVTSIIIANPTQFVHTQNSQISQIHYIIFGTFSQLTIQQQYRRRVSPSGIGLQTLLW